LSTAIGVIQGAHLIIAQLRGEQHWMVNDEDAKRYGQAMANAARHFPLKATQKAIDVTALLMCGAMIETPRILHSVRAARAPKPPPRGPAQVFQFVPPGSPPPPPASPAAPTTSGPAPDSGPGMPPMADGPPDMSAFGGEGA
jgi:hypothetical protein